MAELIDKGALVEKLKRNSIFEIVTNSADKNVFEIIGDLPSTTESEIRASTIEEFKRRLIINFNDWQMSVAEVGNEKEYETIGQAIIGIEEIAEQLKEE